MNLTAQIEQKEKNEKFADLSALDKNPENIHEL